MAAPSAHCPSTPDAEVLSLMAFEAGVRREARGSRFPYLAAGMNGIIRMAGAAVGAIVRMRVGLVSASAHPRLHRPPRRRTRRIWRAVVALLLVLGVAVVADRVVVSAIEHASGLTFTNRPDLDSDIDGLVIGTARMAPGATAFVAGPHGVWRGAAGIANVRTGQSIRADARMRLESVSKIFTATLILQLEQQRKLHVTDTVQRWLPGLLRSYGSEITVRELLTMSSGLISDSDLGGSRAVALRQLAAVKDAELRAHLMALAEHAAASPTYPVDPIWLIRWAAWLPLLFRPGSGYHYSNLGYDVLGLIAERAAGKPLSTLFQQYIFGPLGLKHTAFDPNGPIQGPHAHGYWIAPNGETTDTTDVHRAKGADGGVISDAQDTAMLLVDLMRGQLLDYKELAGMKSQNLWLGGNATACGGRAFGWRGAGNGYKTAAWVSGNGTRVAVLLLNARHPPFDDAVAAETLQMLYCNA